MCHTHAHTFTQIHVDCDWPPLPFPPYPPGSSVDGVLTLVLLICVAGQTAPAVSRSYRDIFELVTRVTEMARVLLLPRDLRVLFPDSGKVPCRVGE